MEGRLSENSPPSDAKSLLIAETCSRHRDTALDNGSDKKVAVHPHLAHTAAGSEYSLILCRNLLHHIGRKEAQQWCYKIIKQTDATSEGEQSC